MNAIARYRLPVDSFTKLSETSGTIQNTSTAGNMEVSNTAEAGSGIILHPFEILEFDRTMYARSLSQKHPVTAAVLPISSASGGGNGSGGGSGSGGGPSGGGTIYDGGDLGDDDDNTEPSTINDGGDLDDDIVIWDGGEI